MAQAVNRTNRMNWNVWLNVPFLLGVALVLSSPPAGVITALAPETQRLSEPHEGTLSLPPGDFGEIPFNAYGDRLEIGCEFVVEAGPRIDLYLLTEGDRLRYLSGLPAIESSSRAFENESALVLDSLYAPLEGRYWAIVDNSDFGVARPNADSAVVRYRINAGGIPGWNEQKQSIFRAALFVEGVAFVSGLGLLIVGAAIPARVPQVRPAGDPPKARRVRKPLAPPSPPPPGVP